jgi:hypothetical protein
MEVKLWIKKNKSTRQIQAAGVNIFWEVSRGFKNEEALKELNIYSVRRRINDYRKKLLSHLNRINSANFVTKQMVIKWT